MYRSCYSFTMFTFIIFSIIYQSLAPRNIHKAIPCIFLFLNLATLFVTMCLSECLVLQQVTLCLPIGMTRFLFFMLTKIPSPNNCSCDSIAIGGSRSCLEQKKSVFYGIFISFYTNRELAKQGWPTHMYYHSQQHVHIMHIFVRHSRFDIIIERLCVSRVYLERCKHVGKD